MATSTSDLMLAYCALRSRKGIRLRPLSSQMNGLAAAAHVLERGLRPVVLEAGDSAGHSLRQWGHVQLFSPWQYNIDRAAARLDAGGHEIDGEDQHWLSFGW